MQSLAPTAHHPLGPSTWPARSECARFTPKPDVDLEDVDGDDEEPDMSARGRGQVMHKAVAMLLTGDLPTRQRALDGLSDRERDQVQWVVSKAYEITESHGYSMSEARVEQRVTMLKPDGSFEPLYFGTGDFEVGPIDADWKFAQPRNYFMQLVGYALAKMEARGEKRRYAYVVNGRLRKVDKYVLDIETVRTVGYGFLSRVSSPHTRPTACSYCGFCANAAACPALGSESVALVERREDWSLKLPSPHVSQLRDPVWLGAARYVARTYLEPWISAVDFACQALPNGVTPTGYFRRGEKGRTNIVDTKKAFAALEELVGEDVLWEQLGFSITALAKALHEKNGISEEKARALIEKRLAEAGCLEFGEPGSKLIKERGAEDTIRAALSLRRAEQIPEKGTDQNAPEGAA